MRPQEEEIKVATRGIQVQLSEEDLVVISKSFIAEEVYKDLCDMRLKNTHGLDGFHTIFHQKFGVWLARR